jgi:hypothetical protein
MSPFSRSAVPSASLDSSPVNLPHASFDCTFDLLAGAPNAVQDADRSRPEQHGADLVREAP